MATPNPEDMSLLAKVLGAAAAVITPIWGGYKWVDGKLERKADKEDVNRSFEDLNDELATQRTNISKIFDQIRENEQRAQDRHERIMEKIR